uniref:Uncharacterized protein n=1 Tax=Bursaphelenchus xylophilus TaxID=6326 RepID=A0A1I7SKL3_BURXY
MAFYDEKS